VLINISLL